VSDHGESLYDGGFLGHGYALDESQTRIPLVVSNVPMIIEEPWGQVQLRGALALALRDDTGGPARPRLSGGGTGVFQYLGGLARPRQIAYRSATDVIAFDVRDRRIVAPVQHSGHGRAESVSKARAVVNLWERMRLAATSRGEE
jgi:hypothetical protein